jgi:hypothetical protein
VTAPAAMVVAIVLIVPEAVTSPVNAEVEMALNVEYH